jgi:hypothetical protein
MDERFKKACAELNKRAGDMMDSLSYTIESNPHIFPNDPVNHPKHYTSHPSGVECIEITEHMDFCVGNAIKYLWRAGLKDQETSIVDLKKAIFYINRKIKLLETKGGK